MNICKRCGIEFTPRTYATEKYCSFACCKKSNNDARYKHQIPISKKCPACKKNFITRNPQKVFCTPECWRNSKKKVRDCENCGGDITHTRWLRWCGKPECRAAAAANKARSMKKSHSCRKAPKQKLYNCQRCGVKTSNRLNCPRCLTILSGCYAPGAEDVAVGVV